MKSPIVIKFFLSLLFVCVCAKSHAQLSCENPLEYAALAEGNILINSQIEKQITGQLETAALENVIAAEFRKIHEWESKYSSYLQTANGYASQLNAASHIYDDALRILLSIGELRHSVEDNPQGIVATISLNTLYIECATELISCFTLIRNAVSKGTKMNMLTGAERSDIMWAINDKMDAFATKLQKLSLCIRYYNMMDVWSTYTAGYINRDNSSMASAAHERWIRAARATN